MEPEAGGASKSAAQMAYILIHFGVRIDLVHNLLLFLQLLCEMALRQDAERLLFMIREGSRLNVAPVVVATINKLRCFCCHCCFSV